MTKEEIQKSINEIVDEAWARMQQELNANQKPNTETKNADDKSLDKAMEALVEKGLSEEECIKKATEQGFGKDEVAKAYKACADKKAADLDKAKKMKKADEEDDEDDEDSDDSEKKNAKEKDSDKVKKSDDEQNSASSQQTKNESANGGKDEIKSGTPKCEEQPLMRKSLEELKQVLTSDELEVISAWREEIGADKPEETVSKSKSGLIDAEELLATVKKAVTSATEELRKSLAEKDTLIKSMNEKIEKMASAPAYDKRSVDSLEVIEKGSGNEPALNKSQVLDTMLNLQKAGKGVTSYHVAEYEATGKISNPNIANLVKNACKN